MKYMILVLFFLTMYVCAMDVPDNFNTECVICFEMLFEQKEIPRLDEDTGKSVQDHKGNVCTKKVFRDDVIFLRCGHRFHQVCLNRHVSEKIAVKEKYDSAGIVCGAKTNCPMCRDLLKSNEYYGEQEKDRLYDSVQLKETSTISSRLASLFCSCGLGYAVS